jgi:hypothetical protein
MAKRAAKRKSGPKLPLDHPVFLQIADPHNWADTEKILRVLRDVPSVRGMVYGNLAEVELHEWLSQHVPAEELIRDDDHDKTKSDLRFPWDGREFSVQSKCMQTNKIQEVAQGCFKAKVQCDGSDKRRIVLPGGDSIETTNYLVGEFDILATALHPFTKSWDFAFRLNSTLPTSRSKRYRDMGIDEYLLMTTVDIEWPLPAFDPDAGHHWTTDLFELLPLVPERQATRIELDQVSLVKPKDADEPVALYPSDEQEGEAS